MRTEYNLIFFYQAPSVQNSSLPCLDNRESTELLPHDSSRQYAGQNCQKMPDRTATTPDGCCIGCKCCVHFYEITVDVVRHRGGHHLYYDICLSTSLIIALICLGDNKICYIYIMCHSNNYTSFTYYAYNIICNFG